MGTSASMSMVRSSCNCLMYLCSPPPCVVAGDTYTTLLAGSDAVTFGALSKAGTGGTGGFDSLFGAALDAPAEDSMFVLKFSDDCAALVKTTCESGCMSAHNDVRMMSKNCFPVRVIRSFKIFSFSGLTLLCWGLLSRYAAAAVAYTSGFAPFSLRRSKRCSVSVRARLIRLSSIGCSKILCFSSC